MINIRNEFRYWTISKIVFVVLFIVAIIGAIYTGNVAIKSPKRNVDVTILAKDSYVTNDGEKKYFVEVQSQEKISREDVKFAFAFDTLKVGQKIVIKEFETTAFIYALVCFVLSTYILITFHMFWKIVLRIEE